MEPKTFTVYDFLTFCSDEVKLIMGVQAEGGTLRDGDTVIGMAGTLRELLLPKTLEANVVDVYTHNGLLCVVAMQKGDGREQI